MQQPLLWSAAPDGLRYQTGFVTLLEEQALVERIARLELSSPVMHGVAARRRTAHFGWDYEYGSRGSSPGPPIPEFLLPLRERVAVWAGLAPSDFAEALVTEYPPGAAIGWHRDAPMFGDIAGVSLLTSAPMNFRRYVSPAAPRGERAPRRRTHQLVLEPRSAYLLTGTARTAYEHSIPAVSALRYSITFRTLRQGRSTEGHG